MENIGALAFIKESKSVWERLQETDKPIFLYGMGNAADKIIDWCNEHQVKVSGVFASDEFVRGQVFRGFTVCKHSDMVAQYGQDVLVVIAFASESPQLLARFAELAEEHETVAPHLALYNEEELVSLPWLHKHAAELQQVYDGLADDQSRKVFADSLNYKLSGKINYLLDCATEREADIQELFHFGSQEVYMDLGAYNGDTVQEFLRLCGPQDQGYPRIIAVEPDRRNCRKLRKYAEEQAGLQLEVAECGIWNEEGELSFSDSGGRQSTFMLAPKNVVSVRTIDALAAGRAVTTIKMDVEGAEVQALEGGRETITKFKPQLFVAAYHYDMDMYRLPLLIKELNPNYKIYLRKHPYVPAWELNFICVD